MRRAARKDAVATPILEALRQRGYTVRVLNDTGLPDLLVGCHGRWWVLEVKRLGGGLTPAQATLRRSCWFPVVRSVEDALAAVGVGPDREQEGRGAMTETRTTETTRIPVVVTTEYRGIFFGYLPADADLTQSTLTLSACRNCLYWPREVKGFVGLATSGPTAGARIGPAASAMTLHKITACLRMTDQAVAAWEAAPWTA